MITETAGFSGNVSENPLNHPLMTESEPGMEEVAASCQPSAALKLARRRAKRATKPQLLTRDQLDGRTNAAKVFDKLVADIEADLAGHDQLTAIERALVEGFAGSYVSLCHLNAQLALGQPVDLSQHSSVVGALCRVASRLGIQRRAKEVGPSSLNRYLETLAEDETAAGAEQRVEDAGQPDTPDNEERTTDRERHAGPPSSNDGEAA
jgi:hypothetical protein